MRRLTSFDILAPGRRRATVVPRSGDETIGDLAVALGCPGPTSLRIDGRTAAAGQRLVDVVGLRAGAQVEFESGAIMGAPARERSPHPEFGGVVPPRGPFATNFGLGDGVGFAQPPTAGRVAATVVEPVVEIAVVAGPDCRTWIPVIPGRHSVGRSEHSAIRVADPRVELHHGVFDVDADGAVRFTQLTGRVPVRVDGRPCEPRGEVPPGGLLEVGSSLLLTRRAVGGGGQPAPGAAGSIVAGSDPWHDIVRRGPPTPAWDWPDMSAPAPPDEHRSPPATGLVGAAAAGAGALVVASVLGQMLFALFALIGAIASLATWIVGIAAAARRRRAARRAYRADLAQLTAEVESAIDGWRRQHAQDAPTIAETLDGTRRRPERIWAVRPDDHDGLTLAVGIGAPSVGPPIAGGPTLPTDVVAGFGRRLAGEILPVPVAVRPGDGLAVHGDLAASRALVRATLLHLATWCGPADWQLLVVTRDPARWTWAGWLPHARRPDGSHGVVTPDEVDVAGGSLVDDRITVVVTDDHSLFDARTGPARRLLSAHRAVVVAAVRRDQSVPTIYGRVLRLGSTGWAEWATGDPPATFPAAVRVVGIGETVASRAARRLASLVDPEDVAASAAGVPASLQLADIDRPERDVDHEPDDEPDRVDGGVADRVDGGDGPADRIVRRWRRGGVDPPPCTPIGVSADGMVDVDLVRDGPHGLIAGTTGSGKSELLRTLVVGLAARCSPEHLTFVLVDYKGGSTFDACARLPHVVGLVTDLDEGAAERSLVSLESELRRRERLLRVVGAADLKDYRLRAQVDALPRLVVVVDEFAALIQELPHFVSSLVGIAQRGRSLGVHLLLATQRPAGVVSDEIRANTNLRLALRLHDAADARDVVGDELPATLSRSQAGRAVLRLGPGELVVFQAARCTGPLGPSSARLTVTGHGGTVPATVSAGPAPPDGPTELSATVEAVCAANERLRIAPPHRPWVDPLPAQLDGSAIEAGSVGVVDDPAHQIRRPLRWDPRRGNLALEGPLGAGLTSTLVALATAQCCQHAAERLHVYVIDAAGDPTLDALGTIAHGTAVTRLREHERLHRLLARLVGEIDRRLVTADPPVRVLLLIDGLDSLRASLSSGIDRVETLTFLDRVLDDGAAVGVSTVVTTVDTSRVEVADRWTFHGPDLPGRVTVASSALQAQVALGAPGLAALPDRTTSGGPRPVEILTDRIERRTLGASRTVGAGSDLRTSLVVGRDADRLEDAVLTVPYGDHVLVGGASRAGKSSALRVLAAAWRDAHPDGEVVEFARRTPLDLPAGDTPTLVVVDDADRVDEPVLAEVAAGGRPGVTLLIAARMEAVRAQYGHWTRDVARHRCGIVLTSAGEVDGELLGVGLPSRTLVPPRPGLGWVVDAQGPRLVQLAMADASVPPPSDGRPAVVAQVAGSSPSR